MDAPFKVSEKCCDIMKKAPLKQYQKETGRVPFIGITQDEGFMRQRKYNKTGMIWKFVLSMGISFRMIMEIILLPANRTGCVYCAMGCHLEEEPNRYQRLKAADKSMYDFVMRPYMEGGLGFDYVLNYCNFSH